MWPNRSTARPGTSSTSRARSERSPCSPRPASSTATTARSTGHRAVSWHGRAAAAPTSEVRSSAPARLTGPRSAHLEVRTPTPAGASFLRSVASAEEVRLRVEERETHARAYAKGWEEIEGYLLAAGVVDAVLALEERSVVAEMRSEANRLANADHANLVRTAHAAQRQLEAARRLRASGGLESLPEPLRDAARLRLRHPSMSLRELAARASPPTTKASMQRRLAKVVELGES